MHFRCMFTLLKRFCVGRIRLSPWCFYYCIWHAHAFSCICTLHSLYSSILIMIGAFLHVFLSLSFFRLVALWHLNENLLHPETLFVSWHLLLLILLLLMFGSMMIKPDKTFWRTFLDKAFIRNAKSFCQTSPTLTYPLSFTIRVGSHCVTSQPLAHLYLYRSSTPTCMDLIIHYPSLSLTFKVRAL